MDKISDFFKEIKNRVSNPFISSFIISWLISNWRLPIVLFTYSTEDYNKIGFNGFVDFAEIYMCRFKMCYILWFPLLFALIYTFLFPFFRNLIWLADAWFKRWGSVWTKNASKGAMISVGKYLKLRDSYEDREAHLEKIIEKESEIHDKNRALIAEKSDLQEKINLEKKRFNDLSEHINTYKSNEQILRNEILNVEQKKESEKDILAGKIRQLTDENILLRRFDLIEIIDGNWEIVLRDPSDNSIIRHLQVTISGNKMNEQIDTRRLNHLFFQIALFKLNSNREIEFILIPIESTTLKWSKIEVYKLTIEDPKVLSGPYLDEKIAYLSGTMNGTFQAILKRT